MDDVVNSSLSLNDWITLDNEAGTTFRNASMKFVVGGDIHALPKIIARQALNEINNNAPYEGSTAALSKVTESPFFEYHLYSVNTTTTISDKEMKHIQML